MNKNVPLELPNGENKIYNTFEDYLNDVETIVSQKKWNFSKKYKDEELLLVNQGLDIDVKCLVHNQKNKFFSKDIKAWEESHARLKKITQEIASQNKRIEKHVSFIYEMYESNDKKVNHRGWVNFSLVVLEVYGKEDLDYFKNEWFNKMFHGDLEISWAFEKLDDLNKLELVVNKFK